MLVQGISPSSFVSIPLQRSGVRIEFFNKASQSLKK